MQKGGRQIQSSLQELEQFLAAFLGAYRRKAGIVVFYFLIAHGLILNHDKFSVKPDFWLAYAAARRKILTDFVWRTMPFSIKAHSRVAEDGSISFIRKFLCGLRPRPSGLISPRHAL